MQGDDLVAEHVVASLEILGDRRGRGEVVGDHGIGYPRSAADDAGLADLGPLEGFGCGLACRMAIV